LEQVDGHRNDQDREQTRFQYDPIVVKLAGRVDVAQRAKLSDEKGCDQDDADDPQLDEIVQYEVMRWAVPAVRIRLPDAQIVDVEGFGKVPDPVTLEKPVFRRFDGDGPNRRSSGTAGLQRGRKAQEDRRLDAADDDQHDRDSRR